MNNLGHSGRDTVIVLNDNGRSYAPTVSKLSESLVKIRNNPTYMRRQAKIEEIAERIPWVGEQIERTIKMSKAAIREMWEPSAFFEDLGVQMAPHSTVNSYLEKLIWILTGNFAKPGAMYAPAGLVPFGRANAKSKKVSPVVGAKVISGMVPCNVIADEVLTAAVGLAGFGAPLLERYGRPAVAWLLILAGVWMIGRVVVADPASDEHRHHSHRAAQSAPVS